VYRTHICDINQLKARLIEEWQKFDQKVTGWAVTQWRPRLRSSVQEELFEQWL